MSCTEALNAELKMGLAAVEGKYFHDDCRTPHVIDEYKELTRSTPEHKVPLTSFIFLRVSCICIGL